MRTVTTKKCVVCGCEYRTKPSHEQRRKYCSRKCYAEARKTSLLGENNYCWRGGNPPCIDCGNLLPGRFYNERVGRCLSCYRAFNRGKNHYNWQGGKTSEAARIRNSEDYKKWRRTVFERDGYRCIFCGSSGNLQADHILPFAHYPELRLDVSNGRTLCVKCHKATDTYLNKSAHNGRHKKL